ncbi:MAG: hypothetical protein ACK50E_05790 [Bacteroidota bacterium]|jgi:hypothetical protein
MFKIDKYPFGITIGTLAPLIGIFFFYLIKGYANIIGPFEFIEVFFKTKPLLTAGGTLSLVVNIILLTLFLNKRSDKTAIGIFAMTVMYGLIILFSKFFM